MLRKARVRTLTAEVILPLGDLSTKNQGFSIVRHIESRRSLSVISLNCTVLNDEYQGVLTFEKLIRVIDLPPRKIVTNNSITKFCIYSGEEKVHRPLKIQVKDPRTRRFLPTLK